MISDYLGLPSKYLDLSSRHIQGSTCKFLQQQAELLAGQKRAALFVYEYEYGFFISLDDEAEIDPSVPAEFVNLINVARSLGADLIRIDGDAPVCDGLETFEW